MMRPMKTKKCTSSAMSVIDYRRKQHGQPASTQQRRRAIITSGCSLNMGAIAAIKPDFLIANRIQVNNPNSISWLTAKAWVIVIESRKKNLIVALIVGIKNDWCSRKYSTIASIPFSLKMREKRETKRNQTSCFPSGNKRERNKSKRKEIDTTIPERTEYNARNAKKNDSVDVCAKNDSCSLIV